MPTVLACSLCFNNPKIRFRVYIIALESVTPGKRVTGQVKSDQIHLSGNATYRPLETQRPIPLAKRRELLLLQDAPPPSADEQNPSQGEYIPRRDSGNQRKYRVNKQPEERKYGKQVNEEANPKCMQACK
jgi:hypothetical protein